MIKGSINYKGVWLAPGSLAHALYQEGKRKELDLLVKSVAEKDRKLTGENHGVQSSTG